jgi:4'-phosphopantetheinyl transferase
VREPLGGLLPDMLHVWRICLSPSEEVVRKLAPHLSVDEARRANMYRRELDRRRYIVAHGTLRELLGEYTSQTPRDVSFGCTAMGKPFLVHGRGEHCLRFTLSHSGEWAVVGLALLTEVGIDIEQIEPSVSLQAVAEQFFSRSEIEALRDAPSEQRAGFFFTAWARKEAYVKARGDGIVNRLQRFSVSINPGQPPILRSDSLDPCATLRWRIYDLDIAKGYAAAIATEGVMHTIRMMHWM